MSKSKQTAMFHWRVQIATAQSFCKYLETNDPKLLKQWAQFYGVTNGGIKKWARERIINCLDAAGVLWSEFANDPTFCVAALNAADGWLERLALVGADGNVPLVAILKTSAVVGHQADLGQRE